MLAMHLPVLCAGMLFTSPVTAPAAPLAAPRIIMLHGGSLAEPIYLTNWHQNLTFMLAVDATAPISRSTIDTAGAIQVAMFWYGPEWEGFARDTTRLPELTRHLGRAQRGALYLPPQSRTPLLDYYSGLTNPGLRTIAPIGLAILHRAGVPLPGVSDSTLVVAAVESFHGALASGDSAGAMGWLAPDAVVLESGSRETRQEYKDHHLGADMAYARTTRTTRGPINVTIAGDAAWAESTSENTRTAEGRTTRSSGAELMVLSRTAQGWRIRAIHWSSRTRRDP